MRVVTARSMFMYFVPGYKSYKGSPFIKGCGEAHSFQEKGMVIYYKVFHQQVMEKALSGVLSHKTRKCHVVCGTNPSPWVLSGRLVALLGN